MEETEQLKNKTIKSLFWKLFERFGAQIIQFVISIILARLLVPEDYGAIALITVFINISNIFVQSGFSTALIRKLDADELDYSSVFWCGLFIAIILYIILFSTAPYIAEFYKLPILKNVLRVLSLSIIVGTYNSMQNTILAKKLMFKKLFISSFSSVLVSGMIGIGCAYAGLGIWALAIQQLSSIIITTIVMLFTVKWHPKFIFSFKRLKVLFSFGWKLLVSGLLEGVYNNIYSLIIGRKYTANDLAYWNRGEQFPGLIVNNVNGSIASVMYPVFSIKQNNIYELKQLVRRAMAISAYLVFPMMVGLAVVAEPLVKLLLTEKWLSCVPFLQAWCIIYAFMPIHVTNLQVYNALGRSDIFLGLEVFKKIVGVIVLIVTIPFGLEWMIFARILTSVLFTFINALPNTKVLHYSMLEQLKDLIPTILLSTVMGVIVYFTGLIPLHYVAVLVIQIIMGIIIYILCSALFKIKPYLYCKDMLIKVVDKIIGRKNKNKKTSFEQNKELNEEIVLENINEVNNMLKNKKVLLLGGIGYLIPVIDQIHKQGNYAITCDYLPNNIAHKYSDEYHNVSIVDKDAVLKLANKLNIDGVMSFATDPGVTSASYVQEQLGLPSQGPYESVRILQNKALFRKFLADNGFNCPKMYSYKSIDDVKKDIDSFPYPMIVKPVDSAGSKGVTRVNFSSEVLKAVEYAFNCSLSKEIIIEQFLEKVGESSDSDCFSIDGKLVFTSFSNQYFDKNVENEYTPAAYSWPSNMSKEHQEELKSELQRLITLLGMKTSIYNVETRECTDGKAYIMEVSPRGGGNRLSEMLELWTGVDLIKMAVKASIGEEIMMPEIKQNGYISEVILHSSKNGVFDSVILDDSLKNNVVELNVAVNNGDMVENFSGANKMIGTLVLKFDSIEKQNNVMKNIEKFVKIVVK